MAQVSIGQVENLEDLVLGLLSVHEELACSCYAQIAAAENKCEEARKEVHSSEEMLESAIQQEQAAQEEVEVAKLKEDSSQSALCATQLALSACFAQPYDEDGYAPDCSSEEYDVASAEVVVEQAQAELNQAQTSLEQAKENHQAMAQRTALAKLAWEMAQQALEQTQQECTVRLASIERAISTGTARLTAAQRALEHYLETNPPAAQFYAWLKWNPTQLGKAVTPDILRDRMNLSLDQQRLLQEYLYDRNPAYRRRVDKYREQWVTAKGDVERNLVARNARTHLCGELGEQIVRHALAPLGGRIETQGRTFVGDNGRYTKTDLIVTDLRVPVILGRGEGMRAPVGGSIAFEVKCGKADYLYTQKDHMIFQAEGHKQADAHCTLCSRDIHDLPPEKEQELRNALRKAGSPLVGMLPKKNEIDRSCLDFIQHGTEEQL